MLYLWLYPLHTEFSFLNVFRYLSFRIIYAAVTAFRLAILATIGFGLVGFVDDYLKVARNQPKGLSASQKILAQGLVALGIGLFFYFLPGYSTKLSVPFFKNFTPDLGLFYIPFAILVIVGASNAVNLTDGLDGLAVGPVMIAALAYTIVAYVVRNSTTSASLLLP